jgi:hypothetical protein
LYFEIIHGGEKEVALMSDEPNSARYVKLFSEEVFVRFPSDWLLKNCCARVIALVARAALF